MTNWTIRRCVNIKGRNEDENALVDDGKGPGLIGGYGRGWEYIGGNAKPGDTVTVLVPFAGDSIEASIEGGTPQVSG